MQGAGVVVNGRDRDALNVAAQRIPSAQFRDLIDAHLGTTFETCRAAAPLMVARGGSIVNTSSFALLGDCGGTGYPAGKGGVNGLTLAIAAELKEHGVRANVVCPGARRGCPPARTTRVTSRL